MFTKIVVHGTRLIAFSHYSAIRLIRLRNIYSVEGSVNFLFRFISSFTDFFDLFRLIHHDICNIVGTLFYLAHYFAAFLDFVFTFLNDFLLDLIPWDQLSLAFAACCTIVGSYCVSLILSFGLFRLK